MALTGAAFIVIGIGAGYLVDTTDLDFINRYLDFLGLPALIGVPLSFAGCIGWAAHLGRRGRARMAAVVFALPWLILLVGYPLDGIKLHGAAAPVLLLAIPATILAFVLFIMAAVAL
jgi:hypothetical protein